MSVIQKVKLAATSMFDWLEPDPAEQEAGGNGPRYRLLDDDERVQPGDELTWFGDSYWCEVASNGIIGFTVNEARAWSYFPGGHNNLNVRRKIDGGDTEAKGKEGAE